MTRAELKAIQAMWLLKLSYGCALILTGLDKMPFFHLITKWEKYIHPSITDSFMVNPSFFMMLIGIAEIIVGSLILIKTRLGALLGIGWLILVIINLLSLGAHFDLIMRDILIIVGLITLIWLNRAQSEIGH